MEISTFEILFKPLTPTGGALARRVLQGYFLSITNLEDEAYRYRIEFNISLPSPDDPNRRLDGKHVFITDVAGANTFGTLTRVGTTNRYRGFFSIPAKQTMLVTLLPDLTVANFFTDPAQAQFEVRGYVTLALPPRFKSIFEGFVPQSDAPVSVLLNPETRSTFVPNEFPASMSDLDFDQDNSLLALASGRGQNRLAPEPGGPIIINPGITLGQLGDIMLDPALLELNDPERVAMLVNMLAQVEPSAENLDNLNRLLAEAKIPVTAAPREVVAPQENGVPVA